MDMYWQAESLADGRTDEWPQQVALRLRTLLDKVA